MGLWAHPDTWPKDIPAFWDDAWKAIAEMKGLKSFRVALSHTDLWVWKPDHKSLVKLFQSMVIVRVQSYKVEFFWPVELDEVLKEIGEVPFSIEIKAT